MTILKSVTPIVIVLLACIVQSGCSTLNTASNSSAPITSAEGPAPNGRYAVNIFPAFGEERSFQGQIRGNMTVQNAIEESNAAKSLRNSEVKLYRVVQGSGRTLKMPVEMQKNNRSVKFEHDYALHPGDRLVIREKTISGFSNVLSELLSTK